MPKANANVVNAVRVGTGDAGRVVGKSLRELREMMGLTQAEMSRRLEIGQGAVSKIESRGDVQISSLIRYVHALGAKLHIAAVFPHEAENIEHLRNVFDSDGLNDEDQLCFSLFGDDLFRPHRDVVLSIKPEYSRKILEGKKTVELRRRFPLSAPRGTLAYIYSTSPDRAIVGRAEIVDVVKLPVSVIWKKFSSVAFIEKSDFDSYFDGIEDGFALKFANAKPLPRQLQLAELRERFGFEPPQSFLYAKPVLRSALQVEYSNISN
jgi:predicted transcriptional regulator/DNA-binding XRE family transcriptional regulator